MSNNKTVIPGLDTTTNSPFTSVPNSNPQFAPFNNHTVIPGINSGNSVPQQQVNNKPVVGFLYSVSRTGNGEFWPLRVGPNSIGRSNKCDIYLPEATVSEQHAELVVRMLKNPEKIIASICDQRSTCGTMINGESLMFDPRECVSGDIITIGEHYDLLVLLIDVKQLGLNVCPSFIPVDVEQLISNPQQQPAQARNNGSTQIYNSPFVAPQQPATLQSDMPTPPPFQAGRTVGIDGNGGASGSRTEPGKTIFM